MTSEKIPKAGIAKIYTSGCPKIQNKCCQNTGSPSGPWKNFVSNKRSNISKYKPIASTVNASKIMKLVTSVAQEKSGMRMKLMLGARCRMTVTIKFRAVKIVHDPELCTPNTEKSVLSCGVNNELDSVAYPVHPIAGALFKKNAMLNTIAPDKNNQNPTAFKYGKAKSRAPI